MIESHRNDSKTRKLSALWTKTERRWKAIFHLRTVDLKTTEKRFLHQIVTGDEKWIFYDNPKKKKYYAKPSQSLSLTSTSQHQHHGRTFMVRRSCFISDGTKRILFTMSCWNLAIPLRAIGIGYNWFVWAVHCEKNGRNMSKDMIKLFFWQCSASCR